MQVQCACCCRFALLDAALSAHPLVSFLGRQLLADLVAAAGSGDLALEELGMLRQLLGASAAAAAVPGAPWGAGSGAEAVVDALAVILQVWHVSEPLPCCMHA